jgi:hypothetical protein
LLDEGVATLLNAFDPPEDAVFADLGSGRGGALLRIAASTPWQHCVGVEMVDAKHEAATLALQQCSSALQSPVTLLRGDVLDIESMAAGADGAPEAAADGVAALSELTHAYTCSVCFDDFLLRRLARALANRAAFPRFAALVSLRALPSQTHLVHVGTLQLACSWNAAVAGHVYVPADLLERAEADRAIPLLARCLCDADTCALPPALQPWPSGTFVRLPRS